MQIRVVIDQTLQLGGNGSDIAQQAVDGTLALVERRQNDLRVNQNSIDLLAAITEYACHLPSVSKQSLDLFVAFPERVGELGHTIQCCTQMWGGLLNRLRQHIQGAFDCVDVPAGSRLRDIEERVVDLIRASGLPKRECRVWLEHSGALRIDLEHFLTQDGIGTDRKTAF
ncbi:Uncharacterised protein [Mycobacteroides abscessus subsp. abscessus]|nr:Uncharacterised protein [Mycobacteroides abscessus subsp. abscessus]